VPPLPVISGRSCITALSKLGYRIIRAAELSVEEFVKLID